MLCTSSHHSLLNIMNDTSISTRKYFQRFYLYEYFHEHMRTALEPVSLGSELLRYRAHEPRSLLFPIKAGDVPCCPRKSFSLLVLNRNAF